MNLFLSPNAAVEIAKLNFSLISNLLQAIHEQLAADQSMRLILSTPNVWFRGLLVEDQNAILLAAVSPIALRRDFQLRRDTPVSETLDGALGPLPCEISIADLHQAALKFANSAANNPPSA